MYSADTNHLQSVIIFFYFPFLGCNNSFTAKKNYHPSYCLMKYLVLFQKLTSFFAHSIHSFNVHKWKWKETHSHPPTHTQTLRKMVVAFKQSSKTTFTILSTNMEEQAVGLFISAAFFFSVFL